MSHGILAIKDVLQYFRFSWACPFTCLSLPFSLLCFWWLILLSLLFLTLFWSPLKPDFCWGEDGKGQAFTSEAYLICLLCLWANLHVCCWYELSGPSWTHGPMVAYLFTSSPLLFSSPIWPRIPSFTSYTRKRLSGLQTVNKNDICSSQSDTTGLGCSSTSLFGLVPTLYLKPLLIRS